MEAGSTEAAGVPPAVPARTVSPAQVAFLVAYVAFVGFWLYAELLAYTKRQYQRVHSHEEEDGLQAAEGKLPLTAAEAGGSPARPGTPAPVTFGGSGFVRCLLLDPAALLEARQTLRAGAEFGTLMAWYYLADRTSVFSENTKHYSRDVLAFIFLVLTVVAGATSLRKPKAPLLLNRLQTEEWKGWMQVLFLLYHYFEAKEIYNAIRVFIAGYVWMTGYGNFMYYYKTNDFSFGRFCQMMWRLNFLVFFACVVLQNDYMLYYICPMHTIFTIFVYAALGIGKQYNSTTSGILVKLAGCLAVIYVFWDLKVVFYTVWRPFTFLVGYSDPRKPTNDLLYEWFFRSSLDRYVWIHGMLCAYLHPAAEALLQRIDACKLQARLAIKAAIIAAVLAAGSLWYHHVYLLPKLQYNAIHPYTSWIPITLWVILRNMTPSLRLYSLGLYGWLGCITLETYISQFHTWLSTGIPNGQPKLLLAFFPAEYPLLNFAATTAVYVYVSFRLFTLTNTLKSVAIPGKGGDRTMYRNFAILGGTAAVLYAGAWLLTASGVVGQPYASAALSSVRAA